MALGDDTIPWSAVMSAIRQWVIDTTGLVASSVVWSDQDHPEAVRPFATLRILAGPAGPATQAELRPRKLAHTWSVVVVTAAAQVYTLTIDGVGYPYSAGGGDTATDIRDGLVAAAAAAPGATVAPGSATGELLVTGDVAGVFHPVLVDPDPDVTAAETRLESGVETFEPGELVVDVQISARLDDAAPLVTQHARAIVGKARAGLWAPTVVAKLRAAGVPPLRWGTVTDLSLLLGAQHETRASLAVTFAVAAGIIDETGQIETLETSGTYT